MVKTKQISLVIPEVLYKESKQYSEEYGYKSVQEFILDVIRRKIILEKIDRYKKIEEEMRKHGKRMTQKQAVSYLKKL